MARNRIVAGELGSSRPSSLRLNGTHAPPLGQARKVKSCTSSGCVSWRMVIDVSLTENEHVSCSPGARSTVTWRVARSTSPPPQLAAVSPQPGTSARRTVQVPGSIASNRSVAGGSELPSVSRVVCRQAPTAGHTSNAKSCAAPAGWVNSDRPIDVDATLKVHAVCSPSTTTMVARRAATSTGSGVLQTMSVTVQPGTASWVSV